VFIRVARPREGTHDLYLKTQKESTHCSRQRVVPLEGEDDMELVGV
jgi:hypothetical protein